MDFTNVNCEPGCPCPDEQTLRAYASATLGRDRMQVVEEHVSTCNSCLEALDASDADSDTLIRVLASRAGSDDDEPAFRELEATLLADAAAVGFGDESTLSLATAATPLTEGAGRTIGGYELLSLIARGGSGAVYRARHVKLNKTVAIKILNAGYVRRDTAALQRFQQEMTAIGQLEHPHIIRATDAGEDQGYHYLVMEYVDGADLSNVLRRHGPLRVADACELVRQAALALHFAHQNGFVHRDVKPSNLLLSASQGVKLLDLGLAGMPQSCGATGETDDELPHGTADYMPPEQWRHFQRVDARADIYSLGCTLFKLLTGRPPFVTPPHDYEAKRRAHCSERAPLLRPLRSDVPLGLQKIVSRMLAKRPTDRFAHALDVAEHLAAYSIDARLTELHVSGPLDASAPEPPFVDDDIRSRLPTATGRRAWLFGAAASLASVATLGGAMFWHRRRPAVLDRQRWRALVPTGDAVSYHDDASAEGAAPSLWRGSDAKRQVIRLQSWQETFVDLGAPVTGQFVLRTNLRLPGLAGRAGLYFQFRPHKAAIVGRTYPYQVVEVVVDGQEPVRLEWSRYCFYQNDMEPTRREVTPLASAQALRPLDAASNLLEITLGRHGMPQVAWQERTLSPTEWEPTFVGRQQSSVTREQLTTHFIGQVGLFGRGGQIEFFDTQLRYL